MPSGMNLSYAGSLHILLQRVGLAVNTPLFSFRHMSEIYHICGCIADIEYFYTSQMQQKWIFTLSKTHDLHDLQ